MNFGRAIHASRCFIGVLDQLQDSSILFFASADRLLLLVVKTCSRNLKQSTKCSHTMLMGVLMNEAVLYSGLSAKYRAAFF